VSFPSATVRLLDGAQEIDVETFSSKGTKHSVPIWVVADGNDVFVRSYRGATGRWYRELVARPGAVVVRGERVPVRAVPAADPESIRRTSEGFKRKYRKGSSLDSMLSDSVLGTTLRLEPA
jgi:hypothetical protein